MNKFSISNYTKRNKFTRMCIGEAMVSLMKEKSYSKIKILDLAVKARRFKNDFLQILSHKRRSSWGLP